LLLTVAGATGAAVMVVELMAVRLLAPCFGQSLPVWTNVIGVVLLALAAGQWLGGLWASRRRGFSPATLLVVAGALSAAIPDLVSRLAPATLPDDLSLGEAYPFVTLGSLLVALLVLAVPMVALGAIAPWLVSLSRDAHEVPGRASGRVLGAGTLGSLVGTFGSTHLLVGALGAVTTVRLAGGVLLLLGILVRRSSTTGVRAATWLVVLVPALMPLLPRPAPPPGLLAEVETPYQLARIVEEPDGMRLLKINEGLDSFHSAYRPGDVWTGRYFDAFVAPALLAPAGPDGVRRVLIVGMGGGTMARQIHALDGSIDVVGVELDAELVRLGRVWLGLAPELPVHAGLDGRLALHGDSGPWGAILIDAYAQQIYVPHHLCTLEYFRMVRERLLPGGVAALNLGGRTREDPVVAAISATFSCVLDGATMARVPGTRNMLLMGWNGPSPPTGLLARRLGDVGAADHLEWMLDGEAFAPVRPSAGPLLRDGDSPVEALAHVSWRGDG
jgi:spermidine synthase